MKLNVTRAFILLLLSAMSFYAFGQQKPPLGKITISSPNAASLGKYGDIPINNHTGIPDISIPIYTVKSGTLEMPITVNYHSSGLKVQEQASWVGAGWSLNAGGMITRTVVSAPDDRGLNSAATDRGHFSDYGYNSYIFSAGPASCGPEGLFICPIGGMYPPQDDYLLSQRYDGEPDLYFFNFNGYSGKFYFNDDRTAVLVPEQDIKITPIYTGTDLRGLTGFILTSSDGTKYHFGENKSNDGNIDAVELTYSASTQSGFTGQGATSGWYLNKVVSPDGQFSIDLIYQAEKYSYYTTSMFPIPSMPNPTPLAYNLEYDLVKNFIHGVRLSKIKFLNGEVNFNAGSLRQDLGLGDGYFGLEDHPNTEARSLGSISIQADDFCKQYKFSYGYFHDGSALTGELFTLAFASLSATFNSDKYRLRLDGIQESVCNSSVQLPPYTFNYYAGTVPRKLSFAIDHWGFYNGIANNIGLIPKYTVTSPANIVSVRGSADRDSRWPAGLNGTLESIIYPTGGKTTFNFEPNQLFSTTTTTSPVQIRQLIANFYGQSQLTDEGFITPTGGTIYVNYNNASNKTATFTITNTSTNTVVNGPLPFVEPGQSGDITISLQSGTTYKVKLTLPDNSPPSNPLTGGTLIKINEYQTFTSVKPLLVGGARIKTIVHNDGIHTNDMVTTYGYNFDNNPASHSSGVLFSRPVYVQAIRNDVYGIVSGQYCSPIGCVTCFMSDASYYQSPSSIRPMASTQGNHIGYGEVTVSQTGNGYATYKYYGSNKAFVHAYDPPVADVCVRSLNILCDPNIPNSPAPPDPFDPTRGMLASEETYNENKKLLKTVAYNPTYEINPMTTPGIISTVFTQNGLGGIKTFTEYVLQTARKTKETVTTSTYESSTGNYLTTTQTTDYGSLYHHDATQSLMTNSKGESIVTKIKSSFDFRISNYNVPDQLSTYNTNIINDLNYLHTAIGAVPPISGSFPGANYYLARVNIFVNYRYKKAMHRQEYLAYRVQNFAEGTGAYYTAHNNAKGAADGLLKPVLQLQDEYINAPIEVSEFKPEKLISSTFNTYQYGSDVATSDFVYPKDRQLINVTTPSPAFTQASVNGNTINKSSDYTLEESYLFKKGLLVQLNPKNGLMTSYLYGYKNAYPVAQVIGVNHATLSGFVNQSIIDNASGQYSDQEIKTELNSINSNLENNGIKALATTYTYKPLVGMTSQTDPTGKTTYYEYDPLGRLDNIRDQDRNVLKRFQYNYASTPAKSTQTSNYQLSLVLRGFRNIRSGALLQRFSYSSNGTHYLQDTRDFYRDGVAKLPERLRTQLPDFYSALDLRMDAPGYNPAAPRFCFMKQGYSVEYRMKLPPTSSNISQGGQYLYYVTVNSNFLAVFADRYASGNDNGTYLVGYRDPEGNVGGVHFSNEGGLNLFNDLKISSDHLFNSFHNVKLKVDGTGYFIYVDNVEIYHKATGQANIADVIDDHIYVSAALLGNDGEIDFVKISDKDGQVQYEENFDSPTSPAKVKYLTALCPVQPDCKEAFRVYFNQSTNSSYTTYEQIAQLYLDSYGELLNVCN